ncbi:MAG: sensor histidine kinase [Cytophagales bacterium]|nr:sensor histidine kinase [Cytophagales bacterium]
MSKELNTWASFGRRGSFIPHLVFWLLIGMSILDNNLVSGDLRGGVIRTGYEFGVVFFSFYASYYNYIYAVKKNKKWLVAIGFLVLLLLYFKLMLADAFSIIPREGTPVLDIVIVIVFWFFLFIYSSMLAHSKLSFDAVQLMNQLERERLKNELNFLRAKINPHFLFNTLNNIYSLAFQKDDLAAPMIAKLSSLMRYTLSDCDTPRVPLGKEFDFLKKYIELQQLKSRIPWNVDVYFEESELAYQIAPLILVNFVENAFKHSGIENDPEGWIKVSGVMEDEELIFTVQNSVKKSKAELIKSTGEGIQNAKRQLELNYPGRYEFVIENESKFFHVTIKIKLK